MKMNEIKLPKFKTRCATCGKFTYIKSGWKYCMQCYEKKYGKYDGPDRDAYVNAANGC